MTSNRWLFNVVLSLSVLFCTTFARAQTAPSAVPPITTPQQPATSDPPAPPDARKSENLVRAAGVLEQQKNWAAARQKLDEAKAVNPQQAFLWSSYAYLAIIDNKPDETILDLQRELANHPEEVNMYTLLSQMQAQQHKLKDAIATLQKQVALDPANNDANSRLASLLLGDKQYTAAEKVLRAILAAHPDSLQMQLLLSTALVRQDKKPEATAILKAMAETSQDPAYLNDAAFALADDQLDLPLAEQTARHALALLDAQSAPGVPDPKPLLRTEILVSVWDTFGWTLFCEGKTAEAEPWVRAAWANSLGAESGYHLGMVLEKLGQPAKAMALYQIASFGDASSNDTVPVNNAARQEALRKAGTPNQVPDGKIALAALRTFKIPGPNALNGQALVEFDLSAKGAASATIVKDDTTHDSLTPVETAIDRFDYKISFPPGSHVTLVRRGILTCHAKTPCEFVLFSTRSAFAQTN